MQPPPGLPQAWGVTGAEWARRTPTDDLAAPGTARLQRAVDCAVPPEQLWPWLCQLRVAPYSYDLVDNLGRRSPRTLVPGLTDLAVGQQAVAVFEIAAFTTGASLTLRPRPGRWARTFGDLLIGYDVAPAAPGSRLVGTLRFRAHDGRLGRAADTAVAWGDLVMMRKQLRTLASLAAGPGGRGSTRSRLGPPEPRG